MHPIVYAVLLIIGSVMASPALAAMSAINPALSQNLEQRPKKVVLLPPQIFVFELSAGGVPTRMADWEAAARDNLVSASDLKALKPADQPSLVQTVPAP